MCFPAPNRHEVEKKFTHAALVEDAVKESGRTRIEKFGLDERIFFVVGIKEPLDVFDAGRSVPNERAFFFCALHELGGVTFLTVRVYWKPNLKDQNRNQYTPHRTTSSVAPRFHWHRDIRLRGVLQGRTRLGRSEALGAWMGR